MPKAKAYVIRAERGRRALDVMGWDVLGGQAKWPMTNVRNLALPPTALVLAGAACVIIGVLGWPLIPVLCILIPLGVAAAFRDARR